MLREKLLFDIHAQEMFIFLLMFNKYAQKHSIAHYKYVDETMPKI